MSYCRWSSNNWDCDLYCYADVYGGYTTHVAKMRRKGPISSIPPVGTVTKEEWAIAYQKQMEDLKNMELVPIGLLFDGKSFNDPDLASFLERVIFLKEVGYHVPDYVIEHIKKESEHDN